MTLNPLTVKFAKNASEFVKSKHQERIHDFISTQDVEDYKNDLQKIWEELGGIGVNPWNVDKYNANQDDDCMPLDRCIDIVKEWCIDVKEEAREAWDKMVKEHNEHPESIMSAYYAGIYRNLVYDNFSFESNVYDIESGSNSIPDDIAGYWAIMIDMHN